MDNLTEDNDLTTLTAKIVSAYVSKNPIGLASLGGLIAEVHAALSQINTPHLPAPVEEAPTPAVPIRKSVQPEYIVCLEDGKHFRSMTGHLKQLGMTPEQYRIKWGLPADYPMAAPGYSALRAKLARDAGLGPKGAAARARKRR